MAGSWNQAFAGAIQFLIVVKEMLVATPHDFALGRKLVSALALACGLFTAATPAQAQEEKVLNIYNWSDYLAEDTIPNFEKETGIKVRYDTYDNNEILHAKLVAAKPAMTSWFRPPPLRACKWMAVCWPSWTKPNCPT